MHQTIEFAAKALDLAVPTNGEGSTAPGNGRGERLEEGTGDYIDPTKQEAGIVTGARILYHAFGTPCKDVGEYGGLAINGLVPRLESGNIGLNSLQGG